MKTFIAILFSLALIGSSAASGAATIVHPQPEDTQAGASATDPDATAHPGQGGGPPGKQAGDSDSTRAFPKKQPSHTGWEMAASAPGKLLYLPFWLVFQATGAAIAIQEEYKVADRVADILIAEDGSRGVLPVYSSRSGVGVEYFHKGLGNPESRFNLSAAWGLRNRQFYQLRQRRLRLFGTVSIGGQLEYRNMPDEQFFGIGPNSREEDKTNYQLKRSVGEIALGRLVGGGVVVGGVLGIEHNQPGPGRDDTSPATGQLFPGLPGSRDEITMTRFTLGMYYDGRNRPIRPSSGFEIEVRGRVEQQVNKSDFGYTMGFADITRYVHLFRDRTLVFRVGARFSDATSDRQIPFYGLSSLGATETIRGFQRGRFRDNDLVLGSIEYRYPVWRTIDALFFVDAGQVQSRIFEDFNSSDTQVTFGGGFVAWKSTGRLLQIEFAKSEDGFRLHFVLNPSSQPRRTFAYF